MAYATLALFRQYTGIQEKDLTDTDATALLTEADKFTNEKLITHVFNEELSGDVDGSNTLFVTAHKPIADRNQSKSTTTADVTVYLVDYDTENNPVSTSATVSDINARDGIITLTTAPTTSNAEVGVFCDYAYYKKLNEPDWNRVVQSSCYYAGYLASKRFDFGIVGPDFLSLFNQTIKDILPFKGFVHGKKKAAFNVKFVRD